MLDARRRRQFLAGACKGLAVQLRNYAGEHAASDTFRDELRAVAEDVERIGRFLRELES